jgi:uncharacterized protein YbjT (DUF2867 family)
VILVTGATGTIGKDVVKGLIAKGEQVRAMIHNPEKTPPASREPGAEYVTGDLEKPETVIAALQGAEKAFLLSPEGPRMPELHGKFASAARGAGVRHLVRLSILPANPEAPLPLAKWHGEADRLVMESGVPYTILRPAYFMQNNLRAARTIASEGAIYGAMGDGKVGHIDTRDIAEVAATVLTSEGHEGQIYPLTGPESLSMAEVAARLSNALGKEIRYVDVPPEKAKAGMMAMGMPDWRADAWVGLGGMIAMGKADMATPAVKDILGREPHDIGQFAAEYAQAFRGA